MGGYNSGGGRGAPREANFWKMDIATLKRCDMLKPNHWRDLVWSTNGKEVARIRVEAFADHLNLVYRSRGRGEDWQTIHDRIPLAFTTPHYGGRRTWFVCPSCNARKGTLWGRTCYRCARCHGMTYASQYEDRASRLLDRAQKIKIRMGGEPSCFAPFPPKPKGMHWRTYESRLADYHRLYRAANDATLAQFGQRLLDW